MNRVALVFVSVVVGCSGEGARPFGGTAGGTGAAIGTRGGGGRDLPSAGTGGATTSSGGQSAGVGGAMAGTSGSGATGTGGMPVATGGVTTGAGGASPGAGGTSMADPLDNASANNGYIQAGPWHGYGWAATYGTLTSISPYCAPGTYDCMKNMGKKICMNGMNQASDATGATLTWNLNQNVDGGTPMPIATSGAGLSITLAVKQPNFIVLNVNPIKVQIQSNINTPDTVYWCSRLLGQPSSHTTDGNNYPIYIVPWSSFNTMCWNQQGTTYAGGTPIMALAVVVSGYSAAAAFPFDICLIDAHQI